MSLRGGPAWDSSRASSLNVCRLWRSCVLTLGTKDSARYSEVAMTTSVPMDVCFSSSCCSMLLNPSEEGSCKDSRMWTSVRLAAEATNKLVSVWSCRSGLMKSGESEEQISVRNWLELVFRNISCCSHIQLSFKMYKHIRKEDLFPKNITWFCKKIKSRRVLQ